MMGRRVMVGFGCVAVAFATLGGCGGSDDADEPTAATADDGTATDGDAESDGDANATGEDDASATGEDDGETTNDGDTANDGDGDTGTGGDDEATGGGDVDCGAIFSMAEVEAWFGEPAELTEDRTDSIGQIVCTWETIEDSNDASDLAFSLITAQIYTGDPVPAENFVDPEIFDEVTMIDGLGDLAFHTDSFGRTYYFVDGGVAGVLSVSDVDMGDADAPPLHSEDEVDALFRDFHARVTG